MGRLFDKNEETKIEPGQITRNGEPVDIESLYEADNSVGLAVESIKPVTHYYDTIRLIETAINGKNPILAAEAYNPLLKSLAGNLGYKAAIPAMEDYNNPYSTNASKQVALESIKGFIKKVWDSIRKFFSDFFRKVSEFGKRLVNANLQIDTYERYVPDLLKKIQRNGLTCSDVTKEVNSKLVMLLAPEGLDRLDGVWVPQNIRPIVQETTLRLQFLDKTILPTLSGRDFPNLGNTISSYYSSIADMKVESDVIDALARADKEVKDFIDHVVKSICPVSADSSDIPSEAFEKLSDLLVDNTMSDLSINMFTDNKSSLTRLPKNFNLIMGISNTDKVYSVTLTEENETKSNTIPVLPDYKALELVFNQYKELTKKFDIKSITKSFNDIDKMLSSFLVQTPKMIDTYKVKYEKFSPGGAAVDLGDDDDEFTGDHYLGTLMGALGVGTAPFLLEQMKKIGSIGHISNLKLNEFDGLRKFIRETVLPFYEDNFDEERDRVLTYGPKLAEFCDSVIERNKDKKEESPLSAIIVKELNQTEKMLINFTQNLQVALRAIETTFPSIVTDLRYELLKYVYDSARQFE